MQKYARRMDAMAETAAVVKGLFGALNDPELISLGIGAPAKEALPVDLLREISNDVLRKDSRGIEALQYGTDGRVLDLREVLWSTSGAEGRPYKPRPNHGHSGRAGDNLPDL